jgi:hypothetical protein
MPDQARMFFFEKKNQKTFSRCGRCRLGPRLRRQKFFASFFQKRRPFLPNFPSPKIEAKTIPL